MSYLSINDFRAGLDARKYKLALPAGSLLELDNAHITAGGEIEKRKAFVRYGLSGGDVRATIMSSSTITISGTVSYYYKISQTPTSPVGYFLATDVGKRVTSSDILHSGILVAVLDQDPIATTYYRTGVIWSDDPYWATLTPDAAMTIYVMPAFFGLEETDAGLTVFGSASAPATLPTQLTYKQLTNPIDSTWKMYRVDVTANFGGKAWVAARFFDANNSTFPDTFEDVVFVFYDGVALGQWYQGYLITATSFINRMYALLDGDNGGLAGFHVTNKVAATSFDVYSDYGMQFTVTAGVVSGTTDDFTATYSEAPISPTPSYGAVAQFKITGGQGGTAIAVSSFSIASPTTITTGVNHGWNTGEWVTLSGFNTANNALNGTFEITVTGLNTFTVAVNMTGKTSQTASAMRSAGIRRLQVTTPAGNTVDLFSYTGTPLVMPARSGDMTADVNNFAGAIAAAINTTPSGYTAINSGAQISIHTNENATSNNSAYLTITGVNDFCTDAASFQLTAANNSDTCDQVNVTVGGVTTNLMNASATGATPDVFAAAIAAQIQAKAATTGYTAAYVVLVDTTTIPNQYTYNVVISKRVRTSDPATDPLPTGYSVNMTGGSAITAGGYVGNGYFPTALHATIADKTYSAGVIYNTYSADATPVISGGTTPYTLSSSALNTANMTWKSTNSSGSFVPWGKKESASGADGPSASLSYANGKFTVLITIDTFLYVKGLMQITATFKDSSAGVGKYVTVTGNLFFI